VMPSRHGSGRRPKTASEYGGCSEECKANLRTGNRRWRASVDTLTGGSAARVKPGRPAPSKVAKRGVNVDEYRVRGVGVLRTPGDFGEAEHKDGYLGGWLLQLRGGLEVCL